MRLFGIGGGNSNETPEERERREASARSLEAGGLPLNAIDRLNEQRGRQGTPGHIFTSDLSVNELAVAHHTGFDPLGQVMGSTMYQVGWQYNPGWSWQSGELQVLTQAFYEARHLALGRLQQEAALLGASGVIGVRLERKQYEWGLSLLEFAAIGTAVRETGAPAPAVGAPPQAPWLSDLSGQEFWALRQAGFRPVGFAIGNCTWYQVPNWRTQNAIGAGVFGSWRNQELPDFTQAVYNARAIAMSRMQAEALALGATGIVGADVEMEVEPREIDQGSSSHRTDLVLHFTSIGTAIAPAPAPASGLTVTPVVIAAD